MRRREKLYDKIDVTCTHDIVLADMYIFCGRVKKFTRLLSNPCFPQHA